MENIFVVDAYTEHRGALYGYLVALTRDVDIAEDAVQEAFTRLTREVRADRAPDNVRAWLFQVGRNLITSAGRHRQVVDRYQPRLVELGDHRSAEEQWLEVEEGRRLHALLANLDAVDRRSLMMAALGYSGAEIGQAIGRSENAVRTRLCRARSRLRAELEPQGIGSA
jgi:RNA polymerase sigma factor (sigma-70 family)